MSRALILSALLAAVVPTAALAAPRAAAAAGSESAAEALLRRTLAPQRRAWAGELLVESRTGTGVERRTVKALFSPPDLRRRETLGADGRARLLIVSDGRVEWVYDAARGRALKGEPADPDVKLLDPDEELELLLRSHELREGPRERVAGREARVLELARRADGKLSLRLWVDEREGLVLKRAAYGDGGEPPLVAEFRTIAFSSAVAPAAFAFVPPPGVRTRVRRWTGDFLEPEEAAAQSGMPLLLPRSLPEGFILESVNVLPYKGAALLHYRFTDGVGLLSLFQYPRAARLRLGWGKLGRPKSVRVGSARGRMAATGDGKILDWKGARHRFVLIGPGSAEALRRVAESIPEVP